MSEDFKVPAKPWTDEKIKFMKAHSALLPDDVRKELGMKTADVHDPVKEPATPVAAPAAPVASTPSQDAQAKNPEQNETKVDSAQAKVDDKKVDDKKDVDNSGAQTA